MGKVPTTIRTNPRRRMMLCYVSARVLPGQCVIIPNSRGPKTARWIDRRERWSHRTSASSRPVWKRGRDEACANKGDRAAAGCRQSIEMCCVSTSRLPRGRLGPIRRLTHVPPRASRTPQRLNHPHHNHQHSRHDHALVNKPLHSPPSPQ